MPAAALPLDDTTDASGITLAEFMRHGGWVRFDPDREIWVASGDPAARLVAKTHFNLLLADQRTELLSLPGAPEDALEKLESLEAVLLEEIAERRRAQASMGAEVESATA